MSNFTYGSVCSGIEAATVAWHPLGWRPAWFSEIEPFPSKVLKHHYPNTPNLGDMTALKHNKIYNESIIDLLVGGTPCQSFSIAGLRDGLDSKNGNLALEFCRLLISKRPRWFIWENVPGVFSSFTSEAGGPDLEGFGPENGADITETSDFAAILSGFSECGYCCAWRVLDSQYFGVAQRRRRVFVVGHIGDDWRPPAAVLLDPKSMYWDPAQSRQQGEEVANTIKAGAGKHGEPTATLTTGGAKHRVDDPYIVMASGQAGAEISIDKSTTLSCLHRESPIIYPMNQITSHENRSNPQPGDPSGTLTGRAPQVIVGTLAAGAHPGGFNGQDISNGLYTYKDHNRIRRLTPLEWERLQGFPDNYTKIPGAADSPRYKALGNSMTVQVMHWIGRRIQIVDNLKKAT